VCSSVLVEVFAARASRTILVTACKQGSAMPADTSRCWCRKVVGKVSKEARLEGDGELYWGSKSMVLLLMLES
jgi:hypothetical protein